MRGFTILEVLLSVSIIAFIVGVGIPIYQSFQNRNELHIATVSIAQSLRRAQVLSQASEGDTSWGLYIQGGSIALYKGADYASRDADFDEIFQIPESLIITGVQEYTYAKFTGEPLIVGAVTLTSVNNESRTVTLNAKGMVDY